MAIDFKGYFQNKNRRQRKINNLGMLESRRWVRNKIVHNHNFDPGPSEAQLALNTANAMIDRIWRLRFTPSLGYSVAGLWRPTNNSTGPARKAAQAGKFRRYSF
jgi:hypothetical protein